MAASIYAVICPGRKSIGKLPDTSADEVQTDQKMKTVPSSFFRPLPVMLAALTLLAGPANAAIAVQMGFMGASGNTYMLEASTNLLNWTPISTNMAETNLFNLLDPNASNFQNRFYRVRQQ